MYKRFALLVLVLCLFFVCGTNAEDLSELEKAMMTTGSINRIEYTDSSAVGYGEYDKCDVIFQTVSAYNMKTENTAYGVRLFLRDSDGYYHYAYIDMSEIDDIILALEYIKENTASASIETQLEYITNNGISIRSVINKGGKYIFISQGETYFIRSIFQEEKIDDIINAFNTAKAILK